MIDSRTQRVGLIGWPVEHSPSPAMHNAAFTALGLKWTYVLLPAQPEKVRAAMRKLVTKGFRGANVTIPHKRAVMPYLDSVSDAAQAIGAVNTIVVRQEKLHGENTDAPGFLTALREGGFDPAGKQALILGAGGAARAVVYALAQAGCTVTLFNRTTQRAAELAHHMIRQVSRAIATWVPRNASLGELPLSDFDLLVNATPLGMCPHVESSPWPEDLPLPPHLTVFDLVYHPRRTRLLAKAHAAGARTIGGLEMLVHQGALAFELWTGQQPPLAVMRAACEQALKAEEE
jgi:shikimate dehydrogenase